MMATMEEPLNGEVDYRFDPTRIQFLAALTAVNQAEPHLRDTFARSIIKCRVRKEIQHLIIMARIQATAMPDQETADEIELDLTGIAIQMGHLRG